MCISICVLTLTAIGDTKTLEQKYNTLRLAFFDNVLRIDHIIMADLSIASSGSIPIVPRTTDDFLNVL